MVESGVRFIIRRKEGVDRRIGSHIVCALPR